MSPENPQIPPFPGLLPCPQEAGMLYRRFYFAPDTGGEGGGTPPEKNEETKTEDAEAMKAELEALRKEKAEREKKAEEERQARMSEEEKAKARIEKERESVMAEYRTLQLQSSGLDDEYASLITGSTADEIKASGDLVRKLIAKVKADTETEVKKGISRTKAPGTGGDKAASNDEEYYREVLKGGNR